MKIGTVELGYLILIGFAVFLVNSVHSCEREQACIWNKVPLEECK